MKTKISASFTKGFSKVLDLNGTKKWPKLSDNRKIDYEAIRSDWESVGKTIEKEFGRYKGNKDN